jgi:WhiB family transcriptional regulator, redox-sensing transcriptional regulator
VKDYPKFEDGTPACSETDPDMWFTEDDEPGYREKTLLKRICNGCEVKEECLQYALKHDVHGYWSNTTPKERSRMRTRLGIKSTPIYSAWDIL